MRYILICCAALMLNACVMRSNSTELYGLKSYDGVSSSYAYDAQELASETAKQLNSEYPKNTLSIIGVNGAYQERLETVLRSYGFALGDDANLRLSYVLDLVQEEQIPTAYLQVKLSDGNQFGFVRKLNAALAPVQLAPVTNIQPQAVVTPLAEPIHNITSMQPEPEKSVNTKTGEFKPLYQVILSVLPKGWKYTIVNEELRNQPSKFTKDQSWQDTITYSAKSVNAIAKFDTKAKRVTILAGNKKSEPVAREESVKKALADLQDKSQSQNSPVQPEYIPTPSLPVAEPLVLQTPTAAMFKIEPGSLYSQLLEWTSKAGYQLVWKASDDLEMEAHTIFRGDIVSAVEELFNGINKSGHALKVIIFNSNKVIVVTDN